jgi:putative ABC transport system permease protein
MWLLTARDLQHRALRFGMAIFGTALLFAMVILVGGVAAGFSSSATGTVNAMNEGTWILPEGASGAFTSYAAFDAGLADEVVADDEVVPLLIMRGVATSEAAEAVATDAAEASSAEATQDIVLVGHVAAGLGGPPVDVGREASGLDEVVASSAAELPIGSSVRVGERDLEVVGTADGMTMFAGTPLLFVDLEVARQIAVEGRPAATTLLTSGTVSSVPDGLVAIAAAEVADDALRLIEDAVGTIDIINVLLWIVAASVIGAVVYLSALDRLRDFAVLKAIGASTRSLLVGLAVQATIVAVVAAVLAIGLAELLVPVFPLQVAIDPGTFIRLPLLAAGVGLLASLGGLRRAVGVDAAAAFSGPGG